MTLPCNMLKLLAVGSGCWVGLVHTYPGSVRYIYSAESVLFGWQRGIA